MEIILVIVAAIIAVIIAYFLGRQSKVKLEEINNDNLRKERDSLLQECSLIEDQYKEKKNLINNIETIAAQRKEQAERDYNKRVEELTDNYNQKENSFRNNMRLQEDRMWNDFQEKKIHLEAEMNQKQDTLTAAYLSQRTLYDADIEELQNELETLKKQRAAAVEAAKMDEQIQKEKDDFRLDITDIEKRDIGMLDSIKDRLSKPRILSMLIWQTYFQPIAKKKFPLLLGKDKVCGIYKITNLKTNEVYIGQSVDVRDRWNQHCKCGLGIDTPARNKLYQSMLKYGLENFAFQLLEKCEPSELDEREKYYIEAYNSVNFGLNATKGNN